MLHFVGAEEVGEGVVVAVPLVDPRGGDGREISGEVDFVDLDEPGVFEQHSVGEVGGDSDGAVAVGTATQFRVESGCGVDGEEGGPSARSEEVSGCSQHGELGSQSTQDVGVDDGVEHARPQRQGTGAGD